MIILDTSIWIEFFRAKEPYYQVVRDLLTEGEVIAIPWIFGELLQGCRSQKEVSVIVSFWKQLQKPSLRVLEDSWIKGGQSSSKEKLHDKGIGIIDCAIASAAQMLGIKVWTIDKKLGSYLKSNNLNWLPIKTAK